MLFFLVGAVGLRFASRNIGFALKRSARMPENSALRCFLDGIPPHRFESTQHARTRRAYLAAMLFFLVGAVGLEPTFPKEADFKSAASANSATLPRRVL